LTLHTTLQKLPGRWKQA